jgi:hypothetical protein
MAEDDNAHPHEEDEHYHHRRGLVIMDVLTSSPYVACGPSWECLVFDEVQSPTRSSHLRGLVT